jgi:hypothetical protein
MSEERARLVDHLLGVYAGVADRVLELRRSTNWIESAVLGMSVLTAGSLWVLISEHFVGPSKWIGAVLATALAFLTSYQKTFGPSKLLEDARALHRDIGAEIAALRANSRADDMRQHWDAVKRFESRLLDLGGPPEPPRGLTTEQKEQWRQQRPLQ